MPSLAGTYNMVVDQGATFYKALIKKDSQGRTIPLPEVDARMQVRETYESLNPILSMTTENNFIVIEESRGVITITISDIITSGLRAGEYVYDLELVYPDDNVERLIMGTFTVRREVTR